MAKKKEITKVKGGEIITPEYMKEVKDLGISALKEYVTPRRLKIVQKQSSDDLLSKYGVGDVIVTPQNDMVSRMERDKDGRPV